MNDEVLDDQELDQWAEALEEAQYRRMAHIANGRVGKRGCPSCALTKLLVEKVLGKAELSRILLKMGKGL